MITFSENVLRPAGRPARGPGAALQEERTGEPALRRKRATARGTVPEDVRRRCLSRSVGAIIFQTGRGPSPIAVVA